MKNYLIVGQLVIIIALLIILYLTRPSVPAEPQYSEADRPFVERALDEYSGHREGRRQILDMFRPNVIRLGDRVCVLFSPKSTALGGNRELITLGGTATICFSPDGTRVLSRYTYGD